MVRTKLKEIADIHMGYSFRSRLEPVLDGRVAIVQMKDLLVDNKVDLKNVLQIDMPQVKLKHLIKAGDLLFRSRGHNSESAMIVENPGVAMVASPLMRIRVLDVSMVLPEYLNWFISQPEAKAFFLSRAEGSSQKMISKKGLESLEVEVPSIKIQKVICEVANLHTLESKLITKLLKLRKKFISEKLIGYAKGELV